MSQINTTDVCNLALSYLGANRITEINDQSVEGQLCAANYDIVRDAMLSRHQWTFATKRFKLTNILAEAPSHGFLYAHQLPEEVLRVIEVNDNVAKWQVEGRAILSDDTVLYIKALVSEPSEAKWSPGFVQAMASRLAFELAMPLTNSRAVSESMLQLHSAKLQAAKASDGMQGYAERRSVTTWYR
jgi:hypothetical protein